jgi:hypothetical protein
MKRLLVPAFALACAAAHAHHGHMHVHQKKDVVQEQVSVTVVECWLGGEPLPESECNQGIANGTLKWADNGDLVAPGTSIAISTSLLAATSSTTPLAKTTSTTQAKAVPTTSSTSTSTAAAKAASSVVAAPVQALVSTGSSSSSSSGSGVNSPFPDGQLDCSTFPSAYGAVSTDWLDLGGWASVQVPAVTLPAGYSNILEMTQSQCSNGNCCVEGAFCAYACPAGYLKYQWPSLQGATGQSVGGVLCQNGKLHLTNPSMKTLCAVGTTNVNIVVQNKLSQEVAICQTNYPGETLSLFVSQRE